MNYVWQKEKCNLKHHQVFTTIFNFQFVQVNNFHKNVCIIIIISKAWKRNETFNFILTSIDFFD